MLPIMRQIITKPKVINPKVFAFADRLRVGANPACLLIQGDSTANGTDEWFYLTMQWLASKFPAYSFVQRLWDDTHQNYSGTISYIQTGSNGDAYLETTGGAVEPLAIADSPGLRITGDLDVAVKVALTDWTPAAVSCLASKFGGAGKRGWFLGINVNGRPYLWFSANGTDLLGGQSSYTEANATPAFTDGQPYWVRVTVDVDNGASGHDIKYYTSTDGTTWTQLGTTITGAGTTSFYATDSVLHIGRRIGGNAMVGKIYKAVIRSGINGKIVASPDAGLAFPASVTTFVDAEKNTCTVGATPRGGSPMVMVLNASHPGAAVAYSTDVTRFALQTPIAPQLAFINYGHNNNDPTGFQAAFDGLCTQILTKYPNVGIIGVTQNPQTSPRTAEQIANHLSTQQQAIAALQAKGYGLVDAYKVMNSSPTTYTNADNGVHPVVVGSQIWAQTVEKYLQQTGKM